jgi:hypothetical protein
MEYISLTGNANAYPGVTECVDGVGGGGTRYDCLGGDEESERSTFTYVSYASPRLDSGIQQSSNEDALTLWEDEDEVGRASLAERLDLCCMRAMKPGMLSLDEGVGWTYTLLFVYNSFTPLPLLVCRIVLYSPSSSSLKS